MESEESMNRARRAALDRIQHLERVRLRWLVVTGAYEGLLLLAFVLLADWNNRDHILLFVAACLVYGTLAFGLFTLQAHINLCTQRILRALHPD